MLRYISAIMCLTLLLAGCDSGAVPGTPTTAPLEATAAATSPTSAAPAETTAVTTHPPEVPAILDGFEVATLTLDGTRLLVAVADDRSERQQGLMHLEDIGDLDGMLFVFDGDTSSGFWMKNTLIPLDIAFFAADGAFVDSFEMQPCVAVPCSTYRPDGSYRYALEMPAGTMPMSVSRIDVEG